jgi:hypothetical protein
MGRKRTWQPKGHTKLPVMGLTHADSWSDTRIKTWGSLCKLQSMEARISMNASVSCATCCSIPRLTGCLDAQQLQLKHGSKRARFLHNLSDVTRSVSAVNACDLWELFSNICRLHPRLRKSNVKSIQINIPEIILILNLWKSAKNNFFGAGQVNPQLQIKSLHKRVYKFGDSNLSASVLGISICITGWKGCTYRESAHVPTCEI